MSVAEEIYGSLKRAGFIASWANEADVIANIRRHLVLGEEVWEDNGLRDPWNRDPWPSSAWWDDMTIERNIGTLTLED